MEIDDKSIRQAIRDIMNYPNIHIQNEDRLVLSRFAFKTDNQKLLEAMLISNLEHFVKYYESDDSIKMTARLSLSLLQKKVEGAE
jgi:hypothetical protein